MVNQTCQRCSFALVRCVERRHKLQLHSQDSVRYDRLAEHTGVLSVPTTVSKWPPVCFPPPPRIGAGHAVLVDFSLAKTGLDRTPDGKTFTFCGSAAYVAPEMLAKRLFSSFASVRVFLTLQHRAGQRCVSTPLSVASFHGLFSQLDIFPVVAIAVASLRHLLQRRGTSSLGRERSPNAVVEKNSLCILWAHLFIPLFFSFLISRRKSLRYGVIFGFAPRCFFPDLFCDFLLLENAVCTRVQETRLSDERRRRTCFVWSTLLEGFATSRS